MIPRPKPISKKAAAGWLVGAVALVGAWEGIKLVAYRDFVNVWTVCRGETEGIDIHRIYTVEECDRMLADRLVEFNETVSRCTGNRPLPDKVRIAFVSLSYNIGKGAFCGSTLARKARAGDLRGACEELPRWNRAGGRVVQGLVNRRAEERRICLEGIG